jgi:hypothetical protein
VQLVVVLGGDNEGGRVVDVIQALSSSEMREQPMAQASRAMVTAAADSHVLLEWNLSRTRFSRSRMKLMDLHSREK